MSVTASSCTKLSVAPAPPPLPIAHVLLDLDAAGAQMVCARLAAGLDTERFAAQVLALQGRGPLAGWLADRGIPVSCLEAGDGFRPELVLRLAAELRAMNAAIVHCHNCKAMLYGGLAALLVPGARVVMTKHGVAHWPAGPVARIGRILMQRAAAVTAVSNDVARHLAKGRWVRPQRLSTIPNGVDTTVFRPAEASEANRGRIGLTLQHRVIGMVQRLSEEKDPLTGFQAFFLVARSVPEARLVVIGDGPLRPDLHTQAAEAGVSDRVLFLGERADVPELLPTLDVFCLPSRTEGTSLSLLEAMACGLPVVATAVGGTPEVVADLRSGLLVPSARPDLLSEALLTVLRSPRQARDMGNEGRRIVCERYSLQTSVARYAALYEEVVAKRRDTNAGSTTRSATSATA